MDLNIGLVIEGLVSILLLLTIGYCMTLNRRLKMLRADESVLRNTIAELSAASQRAEAAIAGLRVAAGEAENHLAVQTRDAHEISQQLAGHVSEGEGIISKLAAITKAASSPKPSPSDRQTSASQSQGARYRVRTTSQERAA